MRRGSPYPNEAVVILCWWLSLFDNCFNSNSCTVAKIAVFAWFNNTGSKDCRVGAKLTRKISTGCCGGLCGFIFCFFFGQYVGSKETREQIFQEWTKNSNTSSYLYFCFLAAACPDLLECSRYPLNQNKGAEQLKLIFSVNPSRPDLLIPIFCEIKKLK